MLVTTEYSLDRKRMLKWLSELEAMSAPAGCLYVPPGASLPAVSKAVDSLLGASKGPPGLADTIAASPTGASLFWGEGRGYLVLPPFPIAGPVTAGNLNTEPVCQLLLKELTIAVVLVRLGAYAVGVFRDETMVASKVGTGNVHSRHRQGGSSSHRFERHRDKQIETFFTRVCGHVREKVEPYARQVDWVIYGGTKETVLEFRKQCGFVQKVEDRVLARPLNIREPKQASLEASIGQVWSSRVIAWKEE